MVFTNKTYTSILSLLSAYNKSYSIKILETIFRRDLLLKKYSDIIDKINCPKSPQPKAMDLSTFEALKKTIATLFPNDFFLS